MNDLDLFNHTQKTVITDSINKNNNDNDATDLGLYAEKAYLEYAMSVVKGRALPQVHDGLKPVQRRIIYAMHQMGLSAGSKPVKCARVVGDVLGKYHPHGDSAAYEALVRLAQSFTLRYPLIDGQGNFGSRDGDGAAAMRYTEARLTPVARLLMDELDEGSVDFIHNYDGSQQEPMLLPARLPMLLLNGASGIAVGMATEILPHNLKEVAYAALALLKNPQLSHDELMTMIPAPDFPGGGHIISTPEEIANAYKTGRGTLRVRGRYTFEELAKGQWQLIFNELPHGSNSAQILQDIEHLINPTVKLGKKTLTPEQIQLKTLFSSLLDTTRDESGKEHAVRLVFEPKTKAVDKQILLNALLKHTALETTVSLNMVCLGLDGRPIQMGLSTVLQQWINYRTHTVYRRTAYHLNTLNDRIHILQGRLLVLVSLDKVLNLIKQSDEPKSDLIHSFDLSHKQADDILDMRLRQLAKLEHLKIEKELNDSEHRVSQLSALLSSDIALKQQLIKEITLDAKQYGDDRRTLVEVADKAVMTVPQNNEPVTVIISQKGWARVRQGHGHDATTFNYKQGDEMWYVAECRSVDNLYAISTTGRVYTIAITDLPNARGDGVPWTTLMEAPINTEWLNPIVGTDNTNLLMITRQGLALRATLLDIHVNRKQGKQFMVLNEGDELAWSLLLPNITPDTQTLMFSLSSDKYALIQTVNDIKYLAGGGKGVILHKLNANDSLKHVCIVGNNGINIIGHSRQNVDKLITDSYNLKQLNPYIGKRATLGKLLEARLKTMVIDAIITDTLTQ